MAETILVADDTPAVRQLIQDTLQNAGYHVLAAADGERALEISAQFSGPIALLVADVVQPGLDGRALAEQIGTQRPEMKVLFISGHGYLAGAVYRVAEPVVSFLAKPFKPQDLLRKVRSVLRGST